MISVNEFETAAALVQDDTSEVMWHDLLIRVRRYLPIKDMMMLVLNVTESCFSDDGIYLPEMQEFATRRYIIDSYTNIRLPENISKQYDLLMQTNIVSTVTESIDNTQLSDILMSIGRKIEYRRNTETQAITKKADEAVRKAQDLMEQIGAIFADITPEDVKKVFSAVTDGKFDERKIVDAYFERKAEEGAGNGEG